MFSLTTVRLGLIALGRNGKGTVGRGLWFDDIFGQFLGNFTKECLNIGRILGTCFQMQQSMFGRVCCRFFVGNDPSIVQIGLVAGEGNNAGGITPSLQFLHPTLGTGERIGRSNVVHDNGSRRAAVIHGSQGTVSFLSGGIPNFEFDGSVVESDRLRQECGCGIVCEKRQSFWRVYSEKTQKSKSQELHSLPPKFLSTIAIIYKHTSNGGLLKFKEFVAHKAYDQTRLSNGRVTQQDEFEVMNARIRSVVAVHCIAE